MVTLITTTLIVTLALTLFLGGFYLKDIKGLWISGVGTGLLIIFGTLILTASPVTSNTGETETYQYGNNLSDTYWDNSNPPLNNTNQTFLLNKIIENTYIPIPQLLNYVLGIILILLGLGGLFQISETYNTMKLNKSEEGY